MHIITRNQVATVREVGGSGDGTLEDQLIALRLEAVNSGPNFRVALFSSRQSFIYVKENDSLETLRSSYPCPHRCKVTYVFNF